ncbi:hypothetical protein [Pendulispora albinea]|uniref:Uncharacterized protein n=1 Tax=Pendulispora albinea TaxID=2741071 RepID=A0ABZ2M5Y4_9BACT
MIRSRLLLSRGLFGFAASAVIFAIAAPGCNETAGVGDPCRPEREYDPTFTGFNVDEVNVESKSYQCQTRLCLVNHFQGRVSCPYGQKIDGTGNGEKGSPCVLPGTASSPVTGSPDPKVGKKVDPQIKERNPEKAVYCSCRCANADGKDDDGANYCKCPDGFTCEQLVQSIGAISSEQLAGGYCVKNGTKYAPQAAKTPCNADEKNCEG